MKKRSELNEKQKKTIYIGALLLFAALMGLTAVFVGRPLVAYAREPAQFKAWIDSYGAFSRVLYILIVVLQVVAAIIPGEPFEIAAGYCFGALEGMVLVLIGETLGCLIIYKLVERYQESLISVFFKEKQFKRLTFLKDPLKAKNLAFILNVIPGTPKDLLSYFIALTPITLKSWLLITLFGRIPSVISSTLGGYYLQQQAYHSTAIVFAITMVISLLGLLAYNLILKRHGREESNSNENDK